MIERYKTSKPVRDYHDPLPHSIQESILAGLAFSPRGSELVALLTVHDFDETYQPFAKAILHFWKRYKEPPGRGHLDDMFAEQLNKDGSRGLRRLLLSISEIEPNIQYLLDNVGTFIHKQRLKAAILEASQRYDQRGHEEDIVKDVTKILQGALETVPRPQTKTIETKVLSNLKARQCEWLWLDRIPLGQHITMTGMPFMGKSLLMLCFAAQYSRGRPNPDGTPALRGRVILLAQEDAIEAVIMPRLKALRADMSRIEVFGWVRTDKGDRNFLLAEDIEALEQLIKDRPDTLMIGIDPITAYIGSGLDSHKTTDVRSVLEPLNKLAERTGVLIWTITHPPKASQSAINAFVGSQAFIAVPRMGYLVAAEELDGQQTGRVLFSCVGSNIGERPMTLAYHIEKVTVDPDEIPTKEDRQRRFKRMLANEDNPDAKRQSQLRRILDANTGDLRTAKIIWDDTLGIDISAQEIMSSAHTRGDAMTDACTFLRSVLRDGPMPSKEVAARATELGISEKTLKRAKTKVCHSYPSGSLNSGGHWMCELKDADEE